MQPSHRADLPLGGHYGHSLAHRRMSLNPRTCPVVPGKDTTNSVVLSG